MTANTIFIGIDPNILLSGGFDMEAFLGSNAYLAFNLNSGKIKEATNLGSAIKTSDTENTPEEEWIETKNNSGIELQKEDTNDGNVNENKNKRNNQVKCKIEKGNNVESLIKNSSNDKTNNDSKFEIEEKEINGKLKKGMVKIKDVNSKLVTEKREYEEGLENIQPIKQNDMISTAPESSFEFLLESIEDLQKQIVPLNKTKDINTEDKSLECNIINLSCKTSENDCNEDTHMCSECGNKYKNSKSLREHIKFSHDLKHLDCPNCSYKTRRPNELKKHQLEVHEGIKKHKVKNSFCDQCAYRATSAAHIKQHILNVHTKREPIKCTYENCDKTYSGQGSLDKHIMFHTGEKPHVCEECGKSFAQKVVLQQHIRVHTGERPYKCKQCGQAFAQATAFRIHKQKHQKEM